jgi:hypothetical protein
MAACLLGCGPGSGGESTVPPEETARPASGTYETTGVTVDEASGEQRPISGRVVVVVEGETYTTHFELSTRWPGGGDAARVIGTGEGRVEGAWLRGRADTQLVRGSVPGVDVGFAFVPREVGTRLTSTSSAEFFADGSVRIEIENRPVEDEAYSPTRTHLVGYRLE